MAASGATSAHVRAAATVTDTVALGLGAPSQIRLAHVWASGQTATAGYFEGEFEVRDTDGRAQTFPGRGRAGIVVDVDLG